MSILCILYLAALLSTILSIMGKAPLYLPVLLLSIGLLLGCLSLY
jgi:hypothetical protein